MKPTKTFDPEILRKLINYDPETGIMVWKHRVAGNGITDRSANHFNAIFAGREALYHVDRQGYKIGSVLGIHTVAHRVAWAIYHGRWPTGEIDHINHVKSDNRIENLREVCSFGNAQNRSQNRNNKSGFTGVCWNKAASRWRATIRADGKIKFLGEFLNKEDAIAARQTANIAYGYHQNHGQAKQR